METIILELNKMTIAEKISFVRNIVTMMTGNADYLTPDPPLADLTTVADETDTANKDAIQVRAESKQKTAIKNEKEDALDKIIRKEANYVENKSDGNEAKIEGAGFRTKSEGAPVGELPPPEDFSITYGDEAGELNMHWDGTIGASGYVVQKNETDPVEESAWNDVDNPTKTKYTVKDLKSGNRYWFRVLAVGTAGRGAPSGVETKIAP
jgi:hypothetical protein